MSEFESELAKAGGQVVVDTAADARKALGTLFGDAAQEMAKLLGDNVRLWRFKNLLRIADEVSSIARDRGISRDQLKALPLGDALRVADAASQEDQPELQLLWARLIANATADPDKVGIQRAFVELLRTMSPAEAALLDLLWAIQKIATTPINEREHPVQNAVAMAEAGWRKFPEEVRWVSIQNLLRMRCIAIEVSGRQYFGGGEEALGLRRAFSELSERLAAMSGVDEELGLPIYVHNLLPEAKYLLTSLARALMAACEAGDRST